MAASVALVLQMLPSALTGLFAGVLIDRANRKAVLAFANVGRALVTVYAAVSTRSGSFGLLQTGLWMALTGMAKAFYMPCVNALLPSVVNRESIQRANALQALTDNTAMIVGPAIAGWGLLALGPWPMLAVTATLFGVGALAMAPISMAGEGGASVRRPGLSLKELGEGVRFYRKNRLAAALLMAIVLVNFAGVPSYTAFEFHVLQTLKADTGVLGLAFSVSSATSLAASYLVALRKRWPRLGRMLALGVLAMGVSFALTGLAKESHAIVWALGVFGAAGPLILIPVGTLFQEVTPSEVRGRVFSLRFVASMLLAPVTAPLVGWSLDTIGSAPVLLGMGAYMGLLAAGGLVLRDIRDAA